MSNAVRAAAEVLAPIIQQATKRAVADNAAGRTMGGVDASRVAADVTREVAAVVVNQTNQEPWYQSRVTWGAIIAVGGGLAGIAGYAVDAQDQAQIVNGIVGITTAVGGLLAWYGRWRAKKPIGQ